MNARVLRFLLRTSILLIAAVPALKQVLILLTRGAGRVGEQLTQSPARTLHQTRAIERLQDRRGLYVRAGAAEDTLMH